MASPFKLINKGKGFIYEPTGTTFIIEDSVYGDIFPVSIEEGSIIANIGRPNDRVRLRILQGEPTTHAGVVFDTFVNNKATSPRGHAHWDEKLGGIVLVNGKKVLRHLHRSIKPGSTIAVRLRALSRNLPEAALNAAAKLIGQGSDAPGTGYTASEETSTITILVR